MEEKYDFCSKCNKKRDLLSIKLDEGKQIYTHFYICTICGSTGEQLEDATQA